MRTLILAVVATLFLGTGVQAQKTTLPGWASEEGYWVIETSVDKPKESTVYFYNNDHQLVYKEQVKNMRLNLERKIVRMSLEKVLSQSIAAYKSEMKAKADEQILAKLISRR